jgi:predicted amidohydrolase
MMLSISIARDLAAVGNKSLFGINFLILPELFNCNYSPDKLEVLEETERVIERLTGLSQKHPEMYLIAGTLPVRDESDDRMTNRSLTFKGGEIIHSISKINLFKPINDHKHFKPGVYTGRFVATVRGEAVRTGVMVCFDLRFPEIARRMALEGMDILFVPAYWSAERDLPWRTLLAARAIENHIFTVGINGDGKSYCYSPTGECRYESRDMIDFATFKIDLNEIAEVKKFINTVDDIPE